MMMVAEMRDGSGEEVEGSAKDAGDDSLAEAEFHDAHFLVFEVAVGGLDDPVESAVLLGVVDLAEGAVQDDHAEPLEAAEPLVEDEAFQVEEPEQAEELAGGVEVVHYGAVLEEEVGEVQQDQVALLQVSEVHPVQLQQREQPGQLQEEPEDLVCLIDSEQLEKVVSLQAYSLLAAVVFG
jgi:hypothetical protein